MAANANAQLNLPSRLGRPLHVPEAEGDLLMLANSIDNIITLTQLSGLNVSGDTILEGDTMLVAFGKIQNEINNILSRTYLTGVNFGTGGSIASTDNLLVSFGKIQNQLDNITTNRTLNGLNVNLTGAITTSDNILQAFGKTQYQFNGILTNPTLTGFTPTTAGAISASDSILTAFQKTQYQFNNILNYTLSTLDVNGNTGAVVASDSIIKGFSKLQNRLTNLLTNTTLTGLTPVNGTVTSADTLISAFSKIEYRLAGLLNTTLNGFVASGGTVTSADSILSAFQKLEYRTAINDTKRPGQDFISGLELYYIDSTHVGVKAGTCYVPSISNMATLATDTSVTMTLAASTLYHFYLTNTGAIENSTTPPATAAYYGTARNKDADNTRRYLGTVKTDATSNIIPFISTACGNRLEIMMDFGNVVSGITTDDTTVRSGDFAAAIYGNQIQYIHVSPTVQLVAADITWQNINLGPILSATSNPGGMNVSQQIETPTGYAGLWRGNSQRIYRNPANATLSYVRQTLNGTTGRSLAFNVSGVGLVR